MVINTKEFLKVTYTEKIPITILKAGYPDLMGSASCVCSDGTVRVLRDGVEGKCIGHQIHAPLVLIDHFSDSWIVKTHSGKELIFGSRQIKEMMEEHLQKKKDNELKQTISNS